MKRKEEFTEFQEFTGVALQKVIKHCSTCWLSLQRAVHRTIEQWPALRSYFRSHQDVEKNGRVKSAAKQLDSAEMKFYFLFLDFILVPLNKFNVMFQVIVIIILYIIDCYNIPIFYLYEMYFYIDFK